jgi:hypothetical protein
MNEYGSYENNNNASDDLEEQARLARVEAARNKHFDEDAQQLKLKDRVKNAVAGFGEKETNVGGVSYMPESSFGVSDYESNSNRLDDDLPTPEPLSNLFDETGADLSAIFEMFPDFDRSLIKADYAKTQSAEKTIFNIVEGRILSKAVIGGGRMEQKEEDEPETLSLEYYVQNPAEYRPETEMASFAASIYSEKGKRFVRWDSDADTVSMSPTKDIFVFFKHDTGYDIGCRFTTRGDRDGFAFWTSGSYYKTETSYGKRSEYKLVRSPGGTYRIANYSATRGSFLEERVGELALGAKGAEFRLEIVAVEPNLTPQNQADYQFGYITYAPRKKMIPTFVNEFSAKIYSLRLKKYLGTKHASTSREVKFSRSHEKDKYSVWRFVPNENHDGYIIRFGDFTGKCLQVQIYNTTACIASTIQSDWIVVPVPKKPNVFYLKRERTGKIACAEGDGTLKVNRTKGSEWEQLRIEIKGL